MSRSPLPLTAMLSVLLLGSGGCMMGVREVSQEMLLIEQKCTDLEERVGSQHPTEIFDRLIERVRLFKTSAQTGIADAKSRFELTLDRVRKIADDSSKVEACQKYVKELQGVANATKQVVKAMEDDWVHVARHLKDLKNNEDQCNNVSDCVAWIRGSTPWSTADSDPHGLKTHLRALVRKAAELRVQVADLVEGQLSFRQTPQQCFANASARARSEIEAELGAYLLALDRIVAAFGGAEIDLRSLYVDSIRPVVADRAATRVMRVLEKHADRLEKIAEKGDDKVYGFLSFLSLWPGAEYPIQCTMNELYGLTVKALNHGSEELSEDFLDGMTMLACKRIRSPQNDSSGPFDFRWHLYRAVIANADNDGERVKKPSFSIGSCMRRSIASSIRAKPKSLPDQQPLEFDNYKLRFEAQQACRQNIGAGGARGLERCIQRYMHAAGLDDED
ncbi:MAG: hypothetical protein FJX46_12580 [Alphaproteobacteria bacterium]|nr:hypothetical protein [Alphaproteobacteria bacterium]